MNMNFRHNLAAAILAPLIFGLLGLILWELFYDVEAGEELAFYASIKPVPDADNALFSLVAINAPLGTTNLREWGRRELASGRRRPRVGVNERLEPSGDTAAETKIYLDLREDPRHFVCWLPGFDREGSNLNCMDEATIREVVQLNRVVMQRYQQVFDYPSLYYELNDNFSFNDTISLTKLAVIDYWLRRDELSQEDVAEIFEMMLFWQRVIQDGKHSFVGMAIALVNYGLTSSLITHLSEQDPKFLSLYYQAHGRFFDKHADAKDVETIVKHEFRMLNTELCFIRQYGDKPVDCLLEQYPFTFKPGRTIKIIHEQRLKYEDCYGPNKRSSDYGDDDDWKFLAKIFARPGNFRGRSVAYLFADGQRKSCEMFENLRLKIETNRFRNFYLDLKRKGISPDQLDQLYRENKELFRVGDSDQFYAWDSENESLVFNLEGFEINYTLPYRL